MSRLGPNVTPLGRLIHDGNFDIKTWNQKDGLIFVDHDGNMVPTHSDAYGPFLRYSPEFVPDTVEGIAPEQANAGIAVKKQEEELSEALSEVANFLDDALNEVAAELKQAKLKEEKHDELQLVPDDIPVKEEHLRTSSSPRTPKRCG